MLIMIHILEPKMTTPPLKCKFQMLLFMINDDIICV